MGGGTLPDWFCPGPEGGWTADDLDRLPPEAPRRLELIHGALVVAPPQSMFHMKVLRNLEQTLLAQAPADLTVAREMTVTLGRRTRPEPDLMVVDRAATTDPGRTTFRPEEVRLAVEVVSPDSEERDRDDKPRLYAGAGIPVFWRVENERGRAAVFVYELDAATGLYHPGGIHRNVMTVARPFPVTIDVAALFS